MLNEKTIATFFVSFLLIVTLFFQVTALKFIWNLETISRLLNALVLGLSLGAFLLTVSHLRSSRRVFLFFIFPAMLVFTGIFINVSRLILDDLSNLTYLGFLLPWCVFLVIPTLCRIDPYIDQKMWRIYYRFMLFFTLVCSIEYLLVSNGYIGLLGEKKTSGGWFQTGRFSLFFAIEAGGSIESRMYGVFLEPGTLGMFLIPVIIWSYLKRCYFGFAVFLIGFALAGSLGAVASLALVPVFYSFVKKKGFFSIGTLVILLGLIGGVVKYDAILETLESKGESKATRVDNLVNGFNELPTLLADDPFGMDLSAKLEYDPSVREENTSQKFATVPIFYQYIIGGVLALVGFLIIVLSSVMSVILANRNRKLSPEDYAVLISVVPMFAFVFQRTSLWDSALFAILFLPSFCRLYSYNSSSMSGIPVARNQLNYS